MSKYGAVYYVADNQVINRVRVGSVKMRNRGLFYGLLAALVMCIQISKNCISNFECGWQFQAFIIMYI